LLGLYIRSIDRKYDIYFEEKCKTPAGNVAVDRLRQYIFVQLQEKHERLALEALFIENGVTFQQIFLNEEFEEVAGIGIKHRKSVGKP